MGKVDNSSRILSIISGAVSIVAGVFILFNNWDLGAVAGFGVGLLIVLIGVLFVVPLGLKSLVVILFGLYCMGQAAGLIERQYLRYGLSIPLIALGVIIILRSFSSPLPDNQLKESS